MSKTISRRRNYTLTTRTVGVREVVSLNVDASNRAFLTALHDVLTTGRAHPREHDSLCALAYDLEQWLDANLVVTP